MFCNETCNYCTFWANYDEEGIRFLEYLYDSTWAHGEKDDWGICDQSGGDTRGDGYCNLFKMHKGLDRRNMSGYY